MNFEDRDNIPEWLSKSNKARLGILIIEDGRKLSSKVVQIG